MDSCSKIIGVDEAALHTGPITVLARFDVLTAARIRRLREIAASLGLLLYIVTEELGSLLPLQGRAELVEHVQRRAHEASSA